MIWATYNPEWLAAVAAAEPGTKERLAERRIAPRRVPPGGNEQAGVSWRSGPFAGVLEELR
uniref:Uncharacterized protein n=1 Tax=Coccidioides posadasii RMSCC 3488 TaxID=454284 RepID=A0A0J6FBC3_COCPO|nr:hypothetical protein CPAG_02888 [Coccidioides posadasii RMSCC 3488]